MISSIDTGAQENVGAARGNAEFVEKLKNEFAELYQTVEEMNRLLGK